MNGYCNNCMSELGADGRCYSCNSSGEALAPHHLKPGTMLCGKYIVGNALGEGGFGITYIGRDITLDMKVAIKEYYPNGQANRNNSVSAEIFVSTEKQVASFEKGKERFISEARNIARFNREKSIVDVRDYFEENGTAYIIMEYLEGEPLSAFVKNNGVINPRAMFAKMIPIMESLDKMHVAGFIHRDISPDNIMHMADGSLKLMDFGSARHFLNEEKKLSVMIKQGYAPEEQYRRNGDQGPWTDVYGLCATMYKCITGVQPEDALDRMRTDNLKRPSLVGINIDESLEDILLYGLAVFKENRCQSMAELLDRTQNALLNVSNKNIHTAVTEEYKTVYAEDGYHNGYTVDADKVFADGYNNQNLAGVIPVKEKEKNKNTGLIILIVALVSVLVIALVALAGFVLLFANSDDSNQDKKEKTAVTQAVTEKAEEVTTTEATQPPTEPATEATAPPVTPVPSGEALYAGVIEDALYKNSQNSQIAKGFLYDLNSDGTKEIVMLYNTSTSCVTSVYTIEGGLVKPLLYEKVLCDNEPGTFACISVEKENGRILFGTNGETGDASGSYRNRYGFWDMFTYSGYEFGILYDSDYNFATDGSNVYYDVSMARVNGKTTTYKEYKDWLNGLDLIAYMSYDLSGAVDSQGHYKPDAYQLSLSDLLSQVR